jgi:hypothetical protein
MSSKHLLLDIEPLHVFAVLPESFPVIIIPVYYLALSVLLAALPVPFIALSVAVCVDPETMFLVFFV